MENNEKRKIEESLARAYAAKTPDILDSVLADCGTSEALRRSNRKGKVTTMTKRSRFSNITKWTAGIAAALVLLVGCTFGISTWLNSGVSATVSIDVNPSLRLELNRHNSVLKILAGNEDAETIVDAVETGSGELETTVNSIVEALVNEGYLTDETNSVLVSVECDDEKKGAELKNELTEKINSALADKELEGSVVSQTVSGNDEIKALAEQYGISVGKARIISKLAADGTHDFDDLYSMSVNELNLLLNQNKNVNDVSTTGTASEKAYIGNDKAVEIALADAAADKEAITGLETELDYEHGVLVYEVEFDFNGMEYEYDINAVTGEIVKAEIDRNDDKDDEKKTDGKETEKEQKEPVPENIIGNDAAASVALAKAELDAANVTGLKSELERKAGEWVYEVEFDVDKTEYEYLINAVTGEIVKEEIDHDEDNNSDIKGEKQTETEETEKEQKEPVPENIIGKDAAKAIALEKAGCTEKAVYSLKAKLEKENGIWIYEVEFELGKTEYEYEIDAVNGSIISEETEEDDKEEHKNREPVPENVIGNDAAASAALAKAGLNAENVTGLKSELDRKKGEWVYEVEFDLDKTEYEYIINAVTGEIVKEEIEK